MRLKNLQEGLERKEYDELVKDITPKKGVEEPFSSYKDQLGFGKFLLLFFSFGLVLYNVNLVFLVYYVHMHFACDL